MTDHHPRNDCPRTFTRLLRLVQVLFLAVGIAATGAGLAQEDEGDGGGSENPALHHVLIPAPNPRDAVAWYAAHFDGTPTTYHYRNAVRFGNGTMLVFEHLSPGTAQPTTLAHLGVFVDDPAAPALAGGPEAGDPPLAVDPAGIALKLYAGNGQSGLAYVAIHSPSPEDALARVAAIIGGTPEPIPHLSGQQGLRYGPAWLTFTKGETTEEGPEQRPVVVGWRIGDTDAMLSRIRERGASVTLGPARFPAHTITRTNGIDALTVELYEPH